MIWSEFLGKYESIVFDCDGVLLNSNSIKTSAFYGVASRYGTLAAEELVKYHVDNGGVSRYEKFRYFVDELISGVVDKPSVDELVFDYSELVRRKLLICAQAEGLGQLRTLTKGKIWSVVSGGAEIELREIFTRRGLLSYFNGGVFGSPRSKDDIFNEAIRAGVIKLPAIYFGDSRYDHESACRAGLDFVFVSGWSEFVGWQDYCSYHRLPFIGSIRSLIGD